jgi:mRNA guanylyltransferase
MQILERIHAEIADKEFINILKERIHSLLGGSISRKPDQFPGGQPVSFTKPHLNLLTQRSFLVCEKSDGMRFLLFFVDFNDNIGEGEPQPVAFLIDRNWKVWGIEGFKCPGDSGHDTLLDGELVENQETGQVSFLLFDILLLGGRDVTQTSLDKRLGFIQNHITGPTGPGYFPLILKQFYKPYGIQELLEKIIPGQSHGNDGLIFTPINEPYQAGSWPTLLKWKPSSMNSVDFKLDQDGISLLVAFGNAIDKEGNRPHEQYAKLDTSHPELVDKILECTINSDSTWHFQRIRDDKICANDSQVVKNIINSIKDNVEKEELIKLIPDIRRRWKEREAAGLVPK